MSGQAADASLDQAVAWAVRLASGAATAQEREACEQWRRAHASHEQAWQQVQAVENTFQGARGDAALSHGILQSADRQRRQRLSRRRAAGLLGCGAVSLALLGPLLRWGRPGRWLEQDDDVTQPGERRQRAMADDGTLSINSGSDVGLRFSPLRRLVIVRRGEVFISTGADAASLTGRRAFWVETPAARLQAVGTRFGVRLLDTPSGAATRLQVTEGRVAVHAGEGPPTAVAQAGETWLISPGGTQVTRQATPDADAMAWTEGALVARRMRLDAFCIELGRHRAAPLRCDPSVAELRVSGVFQLDGPDPVGRALQVLVRTLPLRLEGDAEHGQRLVAR